MGTGEPCVLCDLLIGRGEIEDELDFDGGTPRTLRFHRACMDAWEAERTTLGQ